MKTVSLPKERIHAGDLILVNGTYPYRGTPKEEAMAPIERGILLDRRFAALYKKLLADMRADGKIIAVSGWRSQTEQEQIYCKSLAEHGADFTGKYVALPGHSEHQTGLAVDLALGGADIDFLRPPFPYTGICGEFRAKAGYFGFIERYPKNKERITGIAHEPWHFRYVGAPHAIMIERTGDTLEEYHARLKQFPYGVRPLRFHLGGTTIETSYLASSGDTTVFEVENDAVYMVSGNNVDGFIVTLWRDAA
jgi:D-alanyl-D-alanine dipeptidase/carboxypeptidase